jgi:hypothetical protein
MKQNLIIHDITFVKYYNVNPIINVFASDGLECHYFQCVLTILLLSWEHPPHGRYFIYIYSFLFFFFFFLLGKLTKRR